MTDWSDTFNSLSSDELDALAVLRVIETSNGIIQHMYRNGDPDALLFKRLEKQWGLA